MSQHGRENRQRESSGWGVENDKREQEVAPGLQKANVLALKLGILGSPEA